MTLEEELAMWKAAAQDTAHTLTVTLERLIDQEPVIKTAQAWALSQTWVAEYALHPQEQPLYDAVIEYNAKRSKQS
jgi:hypothetical protein